MGRRSHADGEQVRVQGLRDAAPGAERGADPAVPRVLAVASIITVAFTGSVLVTPLYTLYQRKFGFSEITLTLVYAVYVVGNVLALLAFGQISDQAGRKRAALPALALAAAAAAAPIPRSGNGWPASGAPLLTRGSATSTHRHHRRPPTHQLRQDSRVPVTVLRLADPGFGPLACICRACTRTLEWALFRQREHVRERPKSAG